GRLLLKQVISGQPNIDLELLKKVIYFLEKSKTTEAQYIIGVFYYECFHDYKKAYECFLKSSGDFPSAKVSIAEIIRNGLHEEKPDIDKALEIYLALENECILNPSSKEHTDILPTVLNNIGSIYLCMKDEVLAIIYYERSGNDMARNSLANILWKQGKKEQSMEIFKNLKTIDGQLNYFMKCGVMGTLTKEQINSKIRSLIGPECSAENLGQILITLYINGYEDKKFLLEKSREFNKASETMHELDRIFIQAWTVWRYLVKNFGRPCPRNSLDDAPVISFCRSRPASNACSHKTKAFAHISHNDSTA
ncbi:MAG TPA: hypothetical protein DEG23_00620, partial [Coxiellaceae bacterium]|nr:hypothetical protein [Coxiellaceae bacterium]